MMNPTIARHTFLLDGSTPDAVIPTIVLVVRDADGEIRLVTVDGDHRDAERAEITAERMGGIVLARIEGEYDPSLGPTPYIGTASVWVRR